MERVRQRGLFTPLVKQQDSLGPGGRGRSQAGPTSRWAVLIITILQFAMYSGGFSKYEDLSNEF